MNRFTAANEWELEVDNAEYHGQTSREKDALGEDLPARLGFPKTVGRDLALHQQFMMIAKRVIAHACL